MLKTLSIRNVVLIDSLDIDFSGGLTVLSGETGAGKSILLDSLGLLLGSRSEASLIRTGADKLSVTGIFEIDPENKIYELAGNYDLEIDGDIIIKRIITADGRNKILFNDQIITLKLLRELSRNLIEIHGQHDNQGLLNPATHCGILDGYGDYAKDIAEVKETYTAYKTGAKLLEEKQKRLEQAKEEEDKLVFKVPSLRNIAKTAPYFHDGSVETLEVAVQLMAFYQLGKFLNNDTVQDITAFLESLTGEYNDKLQ